MKIFSREINRGIASGLIVHLILPLLILVICTYPVAAGDLTKEDVYMGLVVAVSVLLLVKMVQKVIEDQPLTRTPVQSPSPSVPPGAPSNSGTPQPAPARTVQGPIINYTQEDLELLARVIHGESRGEPFEGQVAVGAVVLNRVKSDQFPNTIREVIYQPNQFAVVADGQINLTPNNSSYQAAREALAGKDPSLGALFFYNPLKAKTLSWLQTRKTTVQIGNHVFAK